MAAGIARAKDSNQMIVNLYINIQKEKGSFYSTVIVLGAGDKKILTRGSSVWTWAHPQRIVLGARSLCNGRD